MKGLKNKKILITAGPVWAPLDKIRVISNVFTGSLGLLIAEEAAKQGLKSTLLLGPTPLPLSEKLPKNIEIIRFKFFAELYKLMKKEISSKKYDAVVHSAAVADFMPEKIAEGKISSQKNNLIIKLKPTPKIVDKIKGWDPKIFLVKFKLEVNLNKKDLIKRAYGSIVASRADLIVANDYKDIKNASHLAFIIDNKKNILSCRTKKEIAKKLLKKIMP